MFYAQVMISSPIHNDSVTRHRADRFAKMGVLVTNAIALYATLIKGYNIYMPLIYTYIYIYKIYIQYTCVTL